MSTKPGRSNSRTARDSQDDLMAGDKLEKLAGYSYNERPQNPQRAPATHRHARDSAGRPGAGRGGTNGNKEGRASPGKIKTFLLFFNNHGQTFLTSF